jgi:hypothetical protein
MSEKINDGSLKTQPLPASAQFAERMEEMLKELTLDLESEIEGKYHQNIDDMHPSTRRSYERDMEIVVKSRKFMAALAAAREGEE